MKKILIFLLLLSGIAKAQLPGSTLINSRYEWLGGKFRQLKLPAYADTASYPTWLPALAGDIMLDTSGADAGTVYARYGPSAAWVKVTAGIAPSAIDNDNAGTGFNLLRPATQQIKRISLGVGLLGDSTTFANSNYFYVDTNLIYSYARSVAGTGGGGSGNTNSNVGSAYRFAIPNTNNIKTFAAGFGGTIDTLTANQLQYTVDSSVIQKKLTFNPPLYKNNNTIGVDTFPSGLATRLRLQKIADSLAATFGSSASNANIGSGYRVLKPGTQEVKTLFAGTNVTIDSTSNTNGLTISASGSGSSGLSPADTIYILAAGQSNIGGFNAGQYDSASNAKVLGWNGTAFVQVRRKVLPWSWLQNGSNDDSSSASWFYVAKRLQERTQKVVKVVINGWGGNNISQWYGESSTNFGSLKAMVAATGIRHFDFMIWDQGESDGALTDTAYKRYYDTLVAQLDRQTWFGKDIPIYNITTTDTAAGVDHKRINAIIRSISSGLYDRRFTLVEAGLEPTRGFSDQNHFSDVGQYNIANKIVQLMFNRNTFGRFIEMSPAMMTDFTNNAPRIGKGVIVLDTTNKVYNYFTGTTFAPLSSQWITSSANIYAGNTGNVGIGNSSPSYKLDVTGQARITTNLGVGVVPSSAAAISAKGSGTTSATYGIANTNSNGENVFYTQDNHNVGIEGGLQIDARTYNPNTVPFILNSANTTGGTFAMSLKNSALSLIFYVANNGDVYTVNNSWVGAKQYIGDNSTTPTARLHLKGGTTTAATAPLKFTSGTAMTTAEDGAMEYHGSHLYFTIGSTRYQLDQQPGTSGSPGGSNRNLQINNNGVFGAAGSDSLNWYAGELAVKGNVTATADLKALGNAGIGAAPVTGFKLFVKGNGSTSSTYTYAFQNSSAENIAYATDNHSIHSFGSHEFNGGTYNPDSYVANFVSNNNTSTTYNSSWKNSDNAFIFTIANNGNVVAKNGLMVGDPSTAPTSSLDIRGSVSAAQVNKTANYTLTATDYSVNATTGTFTLTLPTAVGCQGRVYILKNSGGGVVTIATTSSQTIGGGTTYTLAPGDPLYVQSDNSGWIILNNVNQGRLFGVSTGNVDITLATARQMVTLSGVTANHTITLPAASDWSGQEIIIWNQNTSGTFSYSFATTVVDAAGATITTLTNSSVYRLLSNGSTIFKVN